MEKRGKGLVKKEKEEGRRESSGERREETGKGEQGEGRRKEGRREEERRKEMHVRNTKKGRRECRGVEK